jgi:hypothetical protein
VFFFALGKAASLPSVFYLALGKELLCRVPEEKTLGKPHGTRQRTGFR